jgi:alginate O-acetyltransferase complex protein AlgI
MVFSDLFFIFVFLPAFIICYLLATVIDKRLQQDTPQFKIRNFVLVLFSLIFYAWGEAVYVILMLACVIINYLAGRMIAHSEKHRRLWLVVGLVLDLCIIGTFKYLGFFADVLGEVGLTVNVPRLALPIGISFYTFQAISYLVDVYRRDTPVQKRFMDLLLYISMFPQLIAGPIVRYGTVAHELHDRHVSAEDFAQGAYRFFIGLTKKVVFANILSEVAEKFLVNGIDDLSMAGAWIGIFAFTLQIYFDFSGYSDMAIGMGRCMGFHFYENFNHPYCCTSVTDFWRRWHMSLGSFFRDYVYIPLGGNRRHQILNIMAVWFLTGMWHGASWNFIIWGLYFGCFVAIEKYTLLRWKWIPTILMRLYSLLVAVIGWGIFYFDDFSAMRKCFASLVGNTTATFSYLEETALLDNFWLWIAAIILCMPIRNAVASFIDHKIQPSFVGAPYIVATGRAIISVALLLLCVALLVGATNNAFIYTRF